MAVSNKNFKALILFRESDYSFLNAIDFKLEVDLIEYDLMNVYLTNHSEIDLIVAYKPSIMSIAESIVNDFNCTLIIDEKYKDQALGLVEKGLYDFFIIDSEEQAELIFQMRKWETSIRIREDQMNKILKKDGELKILFDELKEKTKQSKQELNEAIDELESFSYSVSHDLRAPLRAITGFSGILKDEYIDKLNDEGKRYIEIIQKGTHQMSNLIDDLLNFSRVGRLELRKTQFDPTTMVKEIVDNVKAHSNCDLLF